MTRHGTMRGDVELLGTEFKLHRGQRVNLEPAMNLPSDARIRWFAWPIDADSDDGSMGVWADDVIVDPAVQTADTDAEGCEGGES